MYVVILSYVVKESEILFVYLFTVYTCLIDPLPDLNVAASYILLFFTRLQARSKQTSFG